MPQADIVQPAPGVIPTAWDMNPSRQILQGKSQRKKWHTSMTDT